MSCDELATILCCDIADERDQGPLPSIFSSHIRSSLAGAASVGGENFGRCLSTTLFNYQCEAEGAGVPIHTHTHTHTI